MSHSRNLRLHAIAAAVVVVLALSAGCQPSGPQMRADTFPMGSIDPFNQPPPDKPLFGSADYLRSRDVMPVAKLDIREALPPGVALPSAAANIDVINPTAETAQSAEDQGGSSPASGMAQGITNAQGGGETNQHDGGKTDVPRE